MAKVLIIDDDIDFQRILARRVVEMGHETVLASTLCEGIDLAETIGFEVVFLDVNLPDGSGLTAIRKVLQTESAPEVIIVTGAGEQDGIELAIKSGAWAYLQKGQALDSMELPLIQALKYRTERLGIKASRVLDLNDISGKSPLMLAAYDMLAQASFSAAPVLITGETGTGKELFARAVHRNSRRRDKPMVVVDCASLPQTLVESVLFGHMKGAFTGAVENRKGLVELADQGTLFLDEIGEMPLSLQKVFLRVLQEHKFRPVGSAKEITSDFRLVAATNRNLDAMVAEGTFRSDLLFRIRSLVIETPPLRDRKEDIQEIVRAEVEKLASCYGGPTKEIAPEFIQELKAYNWPGNVRELTQVIAQVMASAADFETLFPMHLPTHVRVHTVQVTASEDLMSHRLNPADTGCPVPKFEDARDKATADYLRKLMAQAGGDVSLASQRSALSRAHLYKLLSKHNIPR